MEKFIAVEIPEKDNNGHRIAWWVPDMCLKVIDILESENPKYNFFQIVTTGNISCSSKFALMKIKDEFINETVQLNETDQLIETIELIEK
jgi:hypothetical protein